MIHSDRNPVLSKHKSINSSSSLPYRTDSCHITRPSHSPQRFHCPDCNHCTDFCGAGALLEIGPSMESTGLSWTVPGVVHHAHGCKWHLLGRNEYDTNTILWVRSTALIQVSFPPFQNWEKHLESVFLKRFLNSPVIKNLS